MRKEVSYLLRLWRDSHDTSTWRASLRNIRTGQVHTFATVAALQEFLAQTATAGAPNPLATPSPEEDREIFTPPSLSSDNEVL